MDKRFFLIFYVAEKRVHKNNPASAYSINDVIRYKCNVLSKREIIRLIESAIDCYDVELTSMLPITEEDYKNWDK